MNKSNQMKLPILMTIGTCFCVLAVGVGIMFQENEVAEVPETTQITMEKSEVLPEASQPVTSAQTESMGMEIAEVSEDLAVDLEMDATEANAITSLFGGDSLAFVYPVAGEVVMPYSMETAIFDPTLAQYRTNDSISLSAVAGTEVYAAEAGVVKEIQKDAQRGTSLVVSHADGWLTTYSQLAADISVAVGETVSKGQKLGVVGEPTKYTIALGEHLEFAMEQDGETKDPTTVVEES